MSSARENNAAASEIMISFVAMVLLDGRGSLSHDPLMHDRMVISLASCAIHRSTG